MQLGGTKKYISTILSSQNEMEYYLIYRLYKPLKLNYEPVQTILEFVSAGHWYRQNCSC